ncbi:MAG TPA: NAD(P)/FAD-dependent oxidoreductase [Myxococcota bacterium]|nr:NAD(P)/FAD-dependent oxidoreductase [Myxococcota bacterium]
MSATVDFDVGVIGGGPAGSAMAAYLAKAGVSVVLLERELFPRPHVGESLVPSSTRAFKELGFLEEMERSGFPRKFGAVWTATGTSQIYEHDWEGLEADSVADIRFAERDQPGVDQTYTWHVDRGRFDLMLLQHAHKLGARVLMGASVKHVDVDSEPRTIRYAIGAHEATIRVRIVVDASGRRTVLGSQLGLKVADPVFDQYAIHTWFEGYDRSAAVKKGAERGDYIFVHFLPLTNSWVWQIPISDTLTSIGVVTQKKHFRGSKAAREEFFWRCVASRAELHDALRAATQVRPFSEEGDYSYAMSQITGDGWLMIGDAARFVDPIFSTGVSIALNSARFAHVDVLEALRTGDLSKASFSTYEATIRRGTRNWYNFISVYYRLNVLFTAFIRDRRYRLDVLKLLQGDVYDEAEPAVLTRMRDIVAEVESNPDHVWHALLGDLTHNAFRPAF